MEIKILHTNDFHGKLNQRAFEILLENRKRADYYFDSGDAVKFGNVSVPFAPDEVWSQLRKLNCTASVPGNREFHVNANVFRKKIEGLGHPMLCGNLAWNGKSRTPLYGDQDKPFPDLIMIDGIGIFGLIVPMVTEKMAARHISSFINSNPISSGHELVAELKGCKLIVCLSHLGTKMDGELAKNVNGIDVIFGGHSHEILNPPILINGTIICQSGSHGRTAGLYTFDLTDSGVELKTVEFIKLS